MGPVLSSQASVHMKHVVSQILKAALLTTQESTASPRSVYLSYAHYYRIMSGGIQTHFAFVPY